MKKKSRSLSSYPAVCGTCMHLIDREKAVAAYNSGREYVHGCGRVLVRAQ